MNQVGKMRRVGGRMEELMELAGVTLMMAAFMLNVLTLAFPVLNHTYFERLKVGGFWGVLASGILYIGTFAFALFLLAKVAPGLEEIMTEHWYIGVMLLMLALIQSIPTVLLKFIAKEKADKMIAV